MEGYHIDINLRISSPHNGTVVEGNLDFHQLESQWSTISLYLGSLYMTRKKQLIQKQSVIDLHRIAAP